ncbi:MULTISPECIES: pilus assembly protein TadG-related protein [unclassified Frankia]|uniref:pilus assembly protein TadG-related protein n=1 Tax=unclassified Frankia TaxID=2632575 RepID=UPI0006EC1FBC|nr:MULTISPECIES: pilus assembly protein TadG-related protein [unclassified Frankia]
MTRRPRDDGQDEGTVTVFVVILAAAFVMFGGLILDAGGALADKTTAMGIAQEAARAGAQQLDLTTYRSTGVVRLLPDEAAGAARAYLAQAGATGTATVADNTVTVTVTVTHHNQLLGIAGLDTLTVTATGSAHPAPPAPGAAL